MPGGAPCCHGGLGISHARDLAAIAAANDRLVPSRSFLRFAKGLLARRQ